MSMNIYLLLPDVLGEPKIADAGPVEGAAKSSDAQGAIGGATAAPESQQKQHIAELDDIILFSNCNPYHNLWKLYADNPELVSFFKIGRAKREACIQENTSNLWEVRRHPIQTFLFAVFYDYYAYLLIKSIQLLIQPPAVHALMKLGQ